MPSIDDVCRDDVALLARLNEFFDKRVILGIYEDLDMKFNVFKAYLKSKNYELTEEREKREYMSIVGDGIRGIYTECVKALNDGHLEFAYKRSDPCELWRKLCEDGDT